MFNSFCRYRRSLDQEYGAAYQAVRLNRPWQLTGPSRALHRSCDGEPHVPGTPLTHEVPTRRSEPWIGCTSLCIEGTWHALSSIDTIFALVVLVVQAAGFRPDCSPNKTRDLVGPTSASFCSDIARHPTSLLRPDASTRAGPRDAGETPGPVERSRYVVVGGGTEAGRMGLDSVRLSNASLPSAWQRWLAEHLISNPPGWGLGGGTPSAWPRLPSPASASHPIVG